MDDDDDEKRVGIVNVNHDEQLLGLDVVELSSIVV